MKISVIIPTYKPKDYLWECLASLANQTFSKECFEVILVLNGCIEPWKSQIESYIIHNMQGINVNFIHTLQGGVSNARNIALDVAKGEYITFIDDDDYVSELYLEELLKNAEKDTIALARPVAFDDTTQKKINYCIESEYYHYYLSANLPFYKPKKFFSGPCMKLIHRDIIGNRRFNTCFKNGEDSLFMFLISDKMKDVNFTSENAIYYRRVRCDSAISNNKNLKYRIRNSIKIIREYFTIFFSNSSKYNLYFFITRILGALKSALLIR